MSNPTRTGFWIFLALLVGLTRIYVAPQYFSIDNVNLALALEKFDPNNHQPQPPGYPLFVAAARAVNFVFRDAWTTFFGLGLLVTALCLPVTVALGKRLFTERAGQTAALLLLLNPVFWQSGLDGPLRVNLALFSLLVAYCSWRAWHGERRYVLWGACALGIGGGFRPDLLPYLFPLWIISAIVGTRSWKWVAAGLAALTSIVLIWTAALVYAVGGPWQFVTLIRTYLADPSTQFTPLNVADQGWMRQVSRLVTWNGLSVVGWAWTIPFSFTAIRSRLRSTRFLFMAVWLVPGLLAEAAFHVAAPGHTLFSVPALCLLGGYFIWTAAERLSGSDSSRIAELSATAAVLLNVLLFLNFYPLPAAPATRNVFRSMENAMAYATFETSFSSVRDPDSMTRETLNELHEFAPTDRPWMIVTTDVYEKNWFTNWRIMRYYAPAADIWVMAQQRQPQLALHVRANQSIGAPFADTYKVEVPKGARIIWLVEQNHPIQGELEKLSNLKRGRYLSYTDVPANSEPFQILSFRFVPSAAS